MNHREKSSSLCVFVVCVLQDYKGGIRKIPTACIAVEDAEMFSRMAKRGKVAQIVIRPYPPL